MPSLLVYIFHVNQCKNSAVQEARTELQETESDIQTAMDGVWETVKQNSSQYEGLQTRHDKLREDLLMLLTTEADNRQNSIAVVQNSFTTGLNQQQADLKALSESTEVLSCPLLAIFFCSGCMYLEFIRLLLVRNTPSVLAHRSVLLKRHKYPCLYFLMPLFNAPIKIQKSLVQCCHGWLSSSLELCFRVLLLLVLVRLCSGHT